MTVSVIETRIVNIKLFPAWSGIHIGKRATGAGNELEGVIAERISRLEARPTLIAVADGTGGERKCGGLHEAAEMSRRAPSLLNSLLSMRPILLRRYTIDVFSTPSP